MRVNLLKSEKKFFSINWLRISLSILFIIISFIMIMNYYHMHSEIKILKKEVKNIEQQLKIYLPRKNEYLELKKKLATFEGNPEINRKFNKWGELMLEIGYIIPDEAMLNYFKINNEILNISGNSEGTEDLSLLINNMKDSPFFNEVKLLQITKQEEISFKINAHLENMGD